MLCYCFKFGLALRHNCEVKIRPNLVDNIVRNFIWKHVKFIRLQTEEVLTYLTDFFPLITRTSENKSACAFDNWRIDENHRKPSIIGESTKPAKTKSLNHYQLDIWFVIVFSVYFVCKIELNLLLIFLEVLVKVRVMRHWFPSVVSVWWNTAGTDSFAVLNTKY